MIQPATLHPSHAAVITVAAPGNRRRPQHDTGGSHDSRRTHSPPDPGYLSTVMPIFNDYGYPVLHVTDNDRTVELNVQLLWQQFQS